MITIELINKYIAGEDGPNFYWRGLPDDFLRLLNELHILGKENGHRIEIHRFPFVTTKLEIIAESIDDQKDLVKVISNQVYISLDKMYWREICFLMLSVSYEEGHNYVEFHDVIEMANFIISSEA